jgi:hypothetical protein
MSTYDAARLADLGYGDTGEATCEMDEAAVRALATVFDDEYDEDGRLVKGLTDRIAEIESTRID